MQIINLDISNKFGTGESLGFVWIRIRSPSFCGIVMALLKRQRSVGRPTLVSSGWVESDVGGLRKGGLL